MSDINIQACSDLADYATVFVDEGCNSTVAGRLEGDNGVSDSTATGTHTDYTDLNDVNDCYVGISPQATDGYDDCDWKNYVKDTFKKVYEFNKSVIAAIGGLWTNVHNIWTSIYNIVDVISEKNTTSVGVDSYNGLLENSKTSGLQVVVVTCQTKKIQVLDNLVSTVCQVKLTCPKVNVLGTISNNTAFAKVTRTQLFNIGVTDSALNGIWANGFQQAIYAGSNKVGYVVLKGGSNTNEYIFSMGQVVGGSSFEAGEVLTTIQTSFVRL